MVTPPSHDVQCGSCTRCCRGEQIVLHPDHGDNLAAYVKVRAVNGLTGRAVWIIPHKPGTKECTYLTEGGCSIHTTRPSICRTFSCVRFYLDTPRAERRRRERAMPGARELFARGRELVEGKA